MSESKRRGQCMCGAIEYEATVGDTFSACFCKMCQRWSAGTFMGTSATHFEITKGEDALTVFKSSDWAERAFCGTCGSNIYYFAEKFGNQKSVAIGSLDSTEGLAIATQYFVDNKPEGFSFVETTKCMTGAEIEAWIASSES